MANQWFFVKDGRRLGPYSIQRIRQLAASGVLQPTDMVQDGVTLKWLSAQDVPELFTPRFAPAAPVPASDVAAPKAAPRAPWSGPKLPAVVAIFIAGLFLFCLKQLGCLPQDLDIPLFDRNPKARIAKEVAESQAILVSAEQMARDYQANEITAQRKYEGKVLEVTGRISTIRSGSTGRFASKPILMLGVIRCEFTSAAQLESLSAGQVVTVRGKCIGRRELAYCSIKSR